MVSHLIIPDVHLKPGHCARRMLHLAYYILDMKPDYVICMGDFNDFESLLGKIPDKELFEAEINKSLDVQEKFFNVIRRRKRKMPKFFMLHGNHEKRLDKVPFDYPDPFLDVWEQVPYYKSSPGILTLDNIHYSHFAVNGTSNRAMTGEQGTIELLNRHGITYTVGHSHILDYTTRVRSDEKRIHGLHCGCFTDEWPDWAGLGAMQWWRGIVFKDDVDNGDYDLNLISLYNLWKEYEKETTRTDC